MAPSNFICFEDVPPQFAISDSFKRFMSMVNPQFQVDLQTIGRECLDVYKDEKVRIKEIFKQFDSHFTDKIWKLKNCVVFWSQIMFFPGESVPYALRDFNIEDKVATLTMINSDCHDELVEALENQVWQKVAFQLNGMYNGSGCI
eukprot:XP_025013125.1 uncharacterized protein LOC112534847 [Ricinus communis]